MSNSHVAETRSAEPVSSESRVPRPGAPLIGQLALVFLFLPMVLYVMGVRPGDISNHAPIAVPRPSLSWSYMDQLNTYVNSAMPLRNDAISWNARMSEDIFGQPPSAGEDTGVNGVVAPGSTSGTGSTTGAETTVHRQHTQTNFLKLPPPLTESFPADSSVVTVGKDGWLYYTDEFYMECYDATPPTQVVAGLKRLEKILAASGRKFVFTVAPDKSTADPQYLPASYADKSCDRASKREVFSLLQKANIPGYVNMRNLIQADQVAQQRAYYMREDTHWNGLADATFAEQAADILNPNLLKSLKSKVSIISYVGDLTRLLGDPQTDKTFTDTLKRPGVSTRGETVSLGAGVTGLRTIARSTKLPLLPGQTLLVGDSFSQAVEPALRPFAANLLLVPTIDFYYAPETMFQEIESSRTVVLVFVERYFTNPNYGVLWSTPFLNKLQANLTKVH